MSDLPAASNQTEDEHSAPALGTTPDVDSETVWHRMSPKFIVVGTLRNLRGFILPAAIIFFSGGGLSGDAARQAIYLVIGLAVSAVAGVFSLIEWANFYYTFTEQEFVVRSGIFQKQERVVPYGRIQAINLDEAPLERLVGIVRVKVETAAGGTADIDVKAVDKSGAYRLRDELAAARARARQTDGDATQTDSLGPRGEADQDRGGDIQERQLATEGELLRRLSTPELLALGATSGRIGPAAAVIGAAMQFGTELMPDSWWDRVPWQRAEALANISLAVTLILVVAVLAWLLAIGSTALTFGGFELRRSGDQLLIKHGLLDRRRRTIPIQRIQAIIVGEQLLRQPFHRADIRFESAGGEVEGAEGDSGVLYPYLPLGDVQQLLDRAVPEFTADPDAEMTVRLPGRAMRRYIVSSTVGWLIFVGIIAATLGFWLDRWIDWVTWQQTLLLLLVTPVFVWLGWARWHDGGWRTNGSTLLLRWRGISRQTLITRIARIQRREMSADVLQRRSNLVTVRLSVASGLVGGHYALPHADRADAERLMAELGGPRHSVTFRKVAATR